MTMSGAARTVGGLCGGDGFGRMFAGVSVGSCTPHKDARKCVLCGRPWREFANRCECGGFCSWELTEEKRKTARIWTPDADRINAILDARQSSVPGRGLVDARTRLDCDRSGRTADGSWE